MAEILLASPFPEVREEPVLWQVKDQTYPAPNHKAILDRRTGKVFSIVSKDYRVIRHEDAIEQIEDALRDIPEMRCYEVKTAFFNAGGRMYREYVFPDHQAPIRPGDLVNLRITLLNSYDLLWPFIVIMGALRLQCLNGLVSPEDLFSIRKRHIYDLEKIQLSKGLRTALDRFSLQVKRWREWAGCRLAPDIYTTVMEIMNLGGKGSRMVREMISQESEGEDARGFPLISVWLFYNVLGWYITHNTVSLNHRVTLEARLRKASIHFLKSRKEAQAALGIPSLRRV